jgi:hypothetical protein
MSILLCSQVFGSAFSDPGVPDDEQMIWRITKQGREPTLSTVIWHIRTVDGKQLYEITVDSGERKREEYMLDKSGLRLIRANVRSETEEGLSRTKIEAKGNRQKLAHEFKGLLEVGFTGVR